MVYRVAQGCVLIFYPLIELQFLWALIKRHVVDCIKHINPTQFWGAGGDTLL